MGISFLIRGIRVIHGQKVSPLKTRFIVNLRSGRAARCWSALKKFAAEQGADVAQTERPRHATDLAKRALDDGIELVVAVGGDGTMNEVASALVGTGAILGLVPCGSGDGLGRHLGLHGPASRALEILRHGRPRLIDSALADGHPFFTAAGLGFEAEIAQRFNQLTQRGFLRYLSTSATAFREWLPEHYTIIHGDQREKVHAFTLVVANSDQYGNNAFIAPGARIDDGRLNLCAIPPITWLNAVPLITRLFAGSIAKGGNVTSRTSDRFVVERNGSGLLHTDGEQHEAGPQIEFVVRPASLRVMCPA